MGSESTIFLHIVFGSIGMGYLVYGRRQKQIMALLSGIGLVVCPYFVSSLVLLVIIGVGLSALPYFVRF